ncbi:MAG: acyltransferase, partial [Chloroflexi bacterium]|nr:acyltransferase [Chloroflexota bacterium]
YSVYLSHLFTANVVGKVWGLFATDSLLDNAIAITIAFALALAVGFLSYRALELPLLKLTRKIA